jgi:lipoyl(octanoyl) transferase
MMIRDLGLMGYREAWAIQEETHAAVLEGGKEHLLLVEHPPVITLGRRAADSARNLLAPPHRLAEMGVELVESDRGGDITFHGPGQLVAYPILNLTARRMSPGAYVHKLEDVVIATLAGFSVKGFKDPAAPGVWVESSPGRAKICAIGIRIRRGVSLHGIALNVTTDLRFFDLINPCGLGRAVTSLTQLHGASSPEMLDVKEAFSQQLRTAFGDPTDKIDTCPPHVDP